MRYRVLSVFTDTGRTYTFRDVNVVCDNESVIQFEYSAMSDGLIKTATFLKHRICGWSKTVETMQPGTLVQKP